MVHQVGVVWGQAAPTSPRSLVSCPMRARISAVGGRHIAFENSRAERKGKRHQWCRVARGGRCISVPLPLPLFPRAFVERPQP